MTPTATLRFGVVFLQIRVASATGGALGAPFAVAGVAFEAVPVSRVEVQARQ